VHDRLESVSQAAFSLAMRDEQDWEMLLNHSITFHDDISQNKLLNSHVLQEVFAQILVHQMHHLPLEFFHSYENLNEFGLNHKTCGMLSATGFPSGLNQRQFVAYPPPLSKS
jgi:hypothetical protein